MYRSAHWDGYSKTIKLLTWNEDGERIIVDRPYKSYLFVEHNSGKYKSIFNTNLKKLEFNTPWDRSQFIKHSNITRLFENVKPAQQFLLDEYEGLNETEKFTANPLKICFFDIETEPLPFDEFPKPELAKAPISLITIHNSLDNKYTTFGTRPFTGTLPEGLNCEYKYCNTEAILIESFIQYIERDHPDILSAWNSNFFDMEYLVNRIEKVLGSENLNRLSPLGKFRITIGKTKDNPPREYKKYICDGMLIMDYIDVYKKFHVKSVDSYRLDFIGELEVGQQKLHYEGTIGEFQKRDWNTFVLYNIRDVELLVRIDTKTNYFGLVRYLGYMGLTNFEDSMGVIVYSVGALCLLARKRNQRLYTPDRKITTGKNEGGYVMSNKGLTKNLFTLDFSSLYPNIIRTLNISIENLIGEFTEIKEEDKVVVTLINGKQHSLTTKQFNIFVTAKKLIKTSANTLFSQDSLGIAPEYMGNLFEKRTINRKLGYKCEQELAKIAKINNNDLTDIDSNDELLKMSSLELKKYQDQVIANKIRYHILQYAQKLALNSLYGCMTSKVSTIGDDRLGNSCTLSGQESIKEVNTFIKDFIQKNYYPDISETDKEGLIQFNDTDSCGITLKCFDKIGITICENNQVTEEGMNIINTIADAVNKHIIEWSKRRFNSNDSYLDLKLEKICDFGLYRKKKNYILHTVFNEGEIDPKTGKYATKWHYAGIELAKSIMTKEIRDIGKKVIEPLVLEQDKFKTDQLLSRAFADFKQLPLTTICKLTRVRTFNKYVKGCKGFTVTKGMQQHVRAAYYHNLILKLENITGYQEIMEGDDCQILMVKPNNKYRIDCIGFKTGDLPKEFLDIFEIDYTAIFKKPFYACIDSLYEIAGWESTNVTDEYAGNIFDLFDCDEIFETSKQIEEN